MQKALDKVRYSRKRFSTLTAEFFILLGCLRQLQGTKIMRDQIQSLFDTDEYADKVPLARSTWSDALANPHRTEILRESVQVLVAEARNELPDRFATIKELGARPNGTYLSFLGWPFLRISSRAGALGFISLG
jgi:hypothetical protein